MLTIPDGSHFVDKASLVDAQELRDPGAMFSEKD